MTSYIGLAMLAAIALFIVWLARRTRIIAEQFRSELERRGLERAAPLPAVLKEKFGYLVARAGPDGTLFLLGHTPGPRVSTAGGGSIATLNLFLGVWAPRELALPDPHAPVHRAAVEPGGILETFADGSQLYLWMRPHTLKNLTHTLATLDYLLAHPRAANT